MLKVRKDSLNWALRHALEYGDTDVFPTPFEYAALNHDWDRVVGYLVDQDVLNWNTRPLRSVLAPKARHGFRIITQLDPLDFLLFSGLVKEIAKDLEASRVSKGRHRVFSYRVQTNANGQLFDPTVGYPSFLEAARKRLDESEGIAYVATTDISDFYSRIYHHRLENALGAATTKVNHVKGIMGFLRGWNRTETFGVPIGSAPMRLLAEIAISDVDEALLASSVDFIRFNDDYRIFSDSYAGAYKHVALLADYLYRNHGLTLQQHKTRVLPVEQFRKEYLSTLEEKADSNLFSKFRDLVDLLELADDYEPIRYEDLTPVQQAAVDSLNLEQILQDQLAADEPDFPIVRFVLSRLGQLGNGALIDKVLSSLDTIHPVLPAVCNYLVALPNHDEKERQQLGERLLGLLDGSVVSQLDYHKMWILDVFARSAGWVSSQALLARYGMETSDLSRRSPILAMATLKMPYWFQAQWRNLFDYPNWTRRAVIAGARCLPSDARAHWRRALEKSLDPVELAVINWVIATAQ